MGRGGGLRVEGQGPEDLGRQVSEEAEDRGPGGSGRHRRGLTGG